jgi:glycosyltransferase A (GT-A) superfamily protein (DUF2064 family)
MKKKAVICFVKTPGLSRPKSRLASSIGDQKALEIYLGLIARISETFSQLESRGIDTIWAITEAEGSSHPLWQDRKTWTQPLGDLGERLYEIEQRASSLYEQWIFIGSDTPALGAELIINTFDLLEGKNWVAGPSLDGGFYLWGSRKELTRERWIGTPYSSTETLQKLTVGLNNVEYLHPLPDLDKIDDIEAVINSLSQVKTPSSHGLLLLLNSYSSSKQKN